MTDSCARTPRVKRRLSRSSDSRSRSSKRTKYRIGSSKRTTGHTAPISPTEASQSIGQSSDTTKDGCTLPGSLNGTISANSGTKRTAEEDVEVPIRHEVEKDDRRIEQGQNRINDLYHGRVQCQSNIEIRIPSRTELAIPSNSTTNGKGSKAQMALADETQPLAVMVTAQTSNSSKTRGGFHHRPGLRDISMLRDRELRMPVQCECIDLPPYFTSTTALPSLSTWKGQRNEFFDHVANIKVCRGHRKALRDHCHRLWADNIAPPSVSYVYALSVLVINRYAGSICLQLRS